MFFQAALCLVLIETIATLEPLVLLTVDLTHVCIQCRFCLDPSLTYFTRKNAFARSFTMMLATMLGQLGELGKVFVAFFI